MAKPREPVKPDPPAESEEEEEETSEEGSESESEPETPQKKAPSTPAPAPKKPDPATPKTQPTAASSSSSEDEESGSDTDSETPAKKPDPNIKPIASKPMDDPAQKTTATTTAKKPRSKPNSSGPTSPTRSTTGAGAKRPAAAAAVAADEGKDAKRSKKKPEAEAESSVKKGNSNDDSRKLFQRLWSEDDEIAILKGMLDYSAKKKGDPLDDLDAFHEFIKKNLHIDVTTVQLKDKIRRLKKKYKNNADKERKGNKERTFSKPHEQKAYDFSKKVWGNEKNVGAGAGAGEEEIVESPNLNGTAVRKSRGKSTVGTTSRIDEVEEKVKEVRDLVSEKNVEVLQNVSFVPDSLRIEEWVLKYGTDLIKDPKKRAEMEEKWRKYKVKEIELLAMRSELMTELTTLILDSLK